MKLKNKILTVLGVCGIALASYAALPTFKTLSAAGNAAAPSVVIFPDDPNLQIRIVNVTYSADTNNAALQYTTGNGAYSLLATNTSSGVTQVVNSTAGLVANSVLVLNHGGTCYAATLSSTNSGTNAVLVSGAWGVAPSIGDAVYQMGSTNAVPVGAATNAVNGEAIYVGNYGRPVMVRLTPCLGTNQLNAVSAHYDSQGN